VRLHITSVLFLLQAFGHKSCPLPLMVPLPVTFKVSYAVEHDPQPPVLIVSIRLVQRSLKCALNLIHDKEIKEDA